MGVNATTTSDVRAYIQASDKSVSELSRELGISRTTIRRWRVRGPAAADGCTASEAQNSTSPTKPNISPPGRQLGASVGEQQGRRRPSTSGLGRYALALWLAGGVLYIGGTHTFLRALDAFDQKGETVAASAKPAVAPGTKDKAGGASPAIGIASLDKAPQAASAGLAEKAPSATNESASAPAKAAPAVPAAAGDGEWVEISGSGINIRSGPSSSTGVVTVQSSGVKLRVLSRNGGWTEVVDPKTDQKGWIFRRYIKASEPPSDVQQTEPSTTGVTQQRTLF